MINLQLPNFDNPSILLKDDKNLREETAKNLINYYWPDFFVVWINSKDTYSEINYQLSFKNKEHCIIFQTEEDWFYHFDVVKMRKRILNSGLWTDKSFIITNSENDYLLSKNFINIKLKPGLLDLIAFYPYDTDSIKFCVEDIRYHTAFLYFAERPGRSKIFNFLSENYLEKISVVKQGNDLISNIDNRDCFFDARANAPHVNIEKDYVYSRFTGFLIAFENFNGLECSRTVRLYSPTLSEKTYKAMHLLKPALIFGGLNTREYLSKLGFDTWDWFIDWSFDKEENPVIRFDYYKKELQRLLSLDIGFIKNLLTKNQDKLSYNRNRLAYLIKNYDKDLF